MNLPDTLMARAQKKNEITPSRHHNEKVSTTSYLMVGCQCVNNLMGLSSHLLTLNYKILHGNPRRKSDINFSHHYLNSGN